ncbi:MAG: hypothetical protein A2901_02690 [Elusimicrobia bacterium RIFCSPLOWO2_01_FULL_54_10]|nr:MAG: hypothetical protein A2901_02690 [Elusimicrobia bacterium RIFCSPLOWO2_01_FULL_54_10]
MKEKYLRTAVHYKGRAVGFRSDEVLLPNGKKGVREYLDHLGAVAVVPFLDSPFKVPLEKARVVMVKQYRYPVRKITEELPAGKLDKGENILSCIKRELKEETGYTAKRFEKLVSYWPTPAFANEVIHIFWADGLTEGRMKPDEDEFLERLVLPFGKLLEKVRSGEIQDSKTMLGLLACAQFLGR